MFSRIPLALVTKKSKTPVPIFIIVEANFHTLRTSDLPSDPRGPARSMRRSIDRNTPRHRSKKGLKLGLSMSCFRWEVYPTHQRTSPEYFSAGNPPLYFSTVPTSIPLDQG